MKYEPATRDDMPEIARLAGTSRKDAMPWLADPHTAEEGLVFFRDMVFPSQTVIVAGATAEMAGFSAFDSSWVNHLYLHPDFQGRGIGKVLLDRAKDATSHLQLWTFQRNARARHFYAREGFVEVRMTDGDNEEREPDVLLEWCR